MKFINKYKSANYDKRKKGAKVLYIIFHYTAMHSDIEALKYLCDKKNKVSSHFLINKKGQIYQLVNLKKRAWHAGESYWAGKKDINSYSVGIEIDNSGKLIHYENYTRNQIFSLIKLLKYLIKKYKISINNILGHSDIAPYRKIDPGEKFPWIKLNNLNLTIIPKNSSKKDISVLENHFKRKGIRSISEKTLFMLGKIGYDTIKAQESKKNLLLLIKAYQSHYRKSLVNGKIDNKTYQIISNHYIQLLTT